MIVITGTSGSTTSYDAGSVDVPDVGTELLKGASMEGETDLPEESSCDCGKATRWRSAIACTGTLHLQMGLLGVNNLCSFVS